MPKASRSADIQRLVDSLNLKLKHVKVLAYRDIAGKYTIEFRGKGLMEDAFLGLIDGLTEKDADIVLWFAHELIRYEKAKPSF